MAQGSVLLADLNGRDLVLAVAPPGASPATHRAIPCASLSDLEEALSEALPPAIAEDLVGGAICAAGPEIDGAITLTGGAGFTLTAGWLRGVLRTPRVHLVNDFTACALGAPKLAPEALETVHAGAAARSGAIAVIGPNLGLGVAGLAPHRSDGWVAMPSEGGHIDFAPGDPREVAVFECLARRHGHISAEHLLSQQGLIDLYGHFAAPTDELSVAIDDNAVVDLCRQGDPAAREAITVFSALLGAYAGDIALLFAARGGVYLNSPLVERLGDLLDREAFCRRFLAKGRMQAYLQDIPVYLARGRCTLLGLSSLFSANDRRYAASEIKYLDC
ncbi:MULTISPECIES: glucokinase [unclassified Caulobacter]|uniref:glucokinase n=1 Tax=unclassified Caulobacter TaxID=2648921 RepID=UPI000D349AE3|nr:MULTISPECIES: glucokinase [unclassified Caulobacter]PTS84179.1 glucokinase [Caulobacter sp. HMWF009]PTT11108.1 glucokinase [Caulobacter sp. HMWF025]